MFVKTLLPISILAFGIWSCQSPEQAPATEAAATVVDSSGVRDFDALMANPAPVLDGKGDDACWQKAAWLPLDQRWIGPEYTAEDYKGRYKLSWDKNYLYVLAEITDDTIVDFHDGLNFYWDDDCLEIFVDENHSGGNHQYNYNALAYHIALDNKVADMGPDSMPHYYNDHVINHRVCNGNTCTWEVAVKIFDDTYKDGAANKPVVLNAGKTMGFALAYCDNDHSKERENFIGSIFVPGADKNRGWIDAGIFGALHLKE